VAGELLQTRPNDADQMPAPAQIRIRGRNFMALVVAPEPPFGEWFAALDGQLRGAAGFFADRPVVADLAAVFEGVGRDAALIALDGLADRGLRLIGVDGVRPAALAGTRWERLATSLHGRDTAQEPRPDSSPAEAAQLPEAAPGLPSLLIDRPVRSGQSIVFEDGDITIVGPVASGAEVIAGGSVHVYGALRGRAIAGLKAGGSRIFCRKLEAELVGVDQLYRTAEHWGPELHGRAVQVRCDRGSLRLSALD
jgi:septum site-determining protein MinC